MFGGHVATALVGAIWYGLAVIVLGVVLVLALGLPAVPDLVAAMLAGMVGALAHFHLRARLGRAELVASIVIGLGAFLALSQGHPLGLSVPSDGIGALVAALVLVAAGQVAIRATLTGLDPAELNRYRAEVLLIRVLKGIGFVFFTSVVVLPFYAMVMTSLKTQMALLGNPLDYSIDLAQGLALLSSYVELFRDFHFGRYILISTVVSVATVVITLLFSIPGAYAVSRLRFPGRAFLSRSILLIYMVPAIVLVIPLYSVFSQLGLRDTLLGLLIIYPATTIPVALYMLQGYFRGIPAELEEAGLIDGLGRIGVILRVTLPLSLPALASVGLYVFMIAWNEFLFAFMFLDDPKIFTLSRAVVSLNSSEVPRQHLMAGAVIVTVPVLVLFLWFERFLVQGLTAGSVKG
jgi:multiple sugar transport system permease protein